MDKIETKLELIDKRTDNYLKLLMNIVYVSTNDNRIRERAEFLLKSALRTAFFLDFYSETNDKDFLKEGNRYKKILYKNVGEKDKKELVEIENRIIKLFNFEKEIWKRVSDGLIVSNEEIDQYWEMKSADALFYSRIINIFTSNKDFTMPIYIYTRILDIVLDIKEYESDSRKKLPNILYMKLSQKMSLKQISLNKRDALIQALEHNINLELKKIISKLIEEVGDFDFNEYEFLKERIKQVYDEFNNEFAELR